MKNINIQSAIIRAVWSSVETIDKQALLHLSDTDIVQQIIERVECVFSLDLEERQSLFDYVNSRVRLIEDMLKF